MSSYIDDIFGSAGYLAEVLPGYAPRPGQIALAHAIDAAITSHNVILGDAPTGTGKTGAYLVPAIYHALQADTSVLVVTSNKALQTQLVEKDLPMLQEVFHKYFTGASFQYALAKGRANYLCKRDFALLDLTLTPNLTPDITAQLDAIQLWETTGGTGDRADAPLGVTDRAWSHVSVTGARCGRRTCSYYKECYANMAEQVVNATQVVVANYDLFFHKLKQGNENWTRFGTVIFDEAHTVADIARKCFGSELSLTNFRHIASDIEQHLGNKFLGRDVRRIARNFFDEVARYAVLNNDKPRLDETNFAPFETLSEILDEVIRVTSTRCLICKRKTSTEGPNCGTCEYIAGIRMRTSELKQQITECLQQTNRETIYAIAKPANLNEVTADTVKLAMMPYRVGPHLVESVFNKFPAVVVVSATLACNGNFNFIREQLGLATPARKFEALPANATPQTIPTAKVASTVYGIRVPSPFNFKTQAKCIIPAGIPWPINDQEDLFLPAATKAIHKLIQDCNGRTLVLFTSWRRLKYVVDNLGPVDYPVLVQGDMPNAALTNLFREDVHSVLFATKSFWAGLDVQGESLSCVIVDKLPLESFSDPLVDMMKTNSPGTFWNEFYYPRAAIELAQGAGRLIRSTSDRGVFVLLDSRIIGKSYGSMMFKSLPFIGFSRNIDDAGKFLRAASPKSKTP